MLTINDRVKVLRKSLNLTQIEFGKKIAIAQGYLTNIENGYREVTDKIIKLICLEFKVNEEWLRSGIGDMYEQKNEFSLDKYAKERGASDIDIEILKIYLNLDKDVRKKIVSDFKKIFVENKNIYINNEFSSTNKEIQTEKEKTINVLEQEPKQKPTIIRVPARGGYYEIEETEESKAALKRDLEKKYEYNPDDF